MSTRRHPHRRSRPVVPLDLILGEVPPPCGTGLVKFYWPWGGGTTSERRVARHQYARNGDDPVTLTVVDNAGQRSMKTQTARIYVYEAP